MCLRAYAHMSTGACRGQKRAAESRELEFLVVVDIRNRAQSSACSPPSLQSPYRFPINIIFL